MQNPETLPQPEFPMNSQPTTSPTHAPVWAQTEALDSQPSSSSSAPAASSSNRIPETLMHKNRLQEYAQRSSLPLPVYTTVNEGVSHAPKFRSTVLVDGQSYTSVNTFSVRKAAEQDVARIALESITKKIKDEGCPLINEDKVLCKSILNEFAVKMNLEKPVYNTSQSKGLLPVFRSSVLFKGETYTGKIGRTKKEAEQLGARAVILSLFGDSRYGTFLTEIIKSKSKLYAALKEDKGSRHTHQDNQSGGASTSTNKDKEIVSVGVTDNVPKASIIEPSLAVRPPHHELKIPKLEPSSGPTALPITFVPQGQPSGEGEGSLKRKHKNKKKIKKKLHTNPQLPVVYSASESHHHAR